MGVEIIMMFKGEIINDKQVKELFERAPKVYIRYFRNYLVWSGKKFIGNKIKSVVTHKSRGRTYTKKVSIQQNGNLRKMLAEHDAIRGGKWAQKFINTAANWRVDKEKLEMRAGILYNSKKKIHEIAEQMESGFSRTSSKYMIVPNYKEVGQFAKPIGLFSSMMNSNSLRPIFKHGNIYYVSKHTKKIYFIGIKKMSVQSQFDFWGAWNAIEPVIKDKSKSILDMATKAVEEGKNV